MSLASLLFLSGTFIAPNLLLADEVKLVKVSCSGVVEVSVLDTRPMFYDGNGNKSEEIFFPAWIREERVIVDEKEDPKTFPGGLKVGTVTLDSSKLGVRSLGDCSIRPVSIRCVSTTRINRDGTFVSSGSSPRERKVPVPEMSWSESPVSKALESLSKAQIEIDRQTGILDIYSERVIKLPERVGDQPPFTSRISHSGRFQCELASEKPKF